MSQQYYARSAIDFYKILRVSHTASSEEIKTAYRRLALELHPDRHEGCAEKLKKFKAVNEAYNVLIDTTRRREYDVAQGRRHRRNIPNDYRKVYAPAPPPEWKTVWNHKQHYDYHYGNGFQKEAFDRFQKEAATNGFEYQSPLGKGFVFTEDDNDDSNKTYNPYSKAPQGPPKLVFEYEEVTRDMSSGREHVTRRERIVQDVYAKRANRQQKRQQRHAQQQQQQRQRLQRQQQPYATFATQNNNNECIIL